MKRSTKKSRTTSFTLSTSELARIRGGMVGSLEREVIPGFTNPPPQPANTVDQQA